MRSKYYDIIVAVLLIIALLLSILLAGCDLDRAYVDGPSTDNSSKVTLDVINYHVGTDPVAEYYSYLFHSFKLTEEGANVEFRFEEIPTVDAFNQKIKMLISSGDLPDIVLSSASNIVELAARSGKVADLTPYFNADPEWKALFDDRSLSFNTVDGKIYGVPASKEFAFIYYNKDLFAQASLTPPRISFESWDEFFAVCGALKEAGVTPLGMDTADSGWLSNLWFSALIAAQSAAGNDWMNTQHPADFKTPEVLAAAEQLRRMFSEYTTPGAVGGTYDQMAAHFFNGEVAMLPNGPGMIGDFRNPDKVPPGFYDRVGVMLMPMDSIITVPIPGDMVGASDPAKVKAAVAFLKYSTRVDNQLKALEKAGLQPVSPQAAAPGLLKNSDPLRAEALDIASRAKTSCGHIHAYWRRNVVDAFSASLPGLAYGSMTPAEFCAKLSEAALKK